MSAQILSREFTPCSKLSKKDLDIIWICPHLELDRTTPNPRTLSTKTRNKVIDHTLYNIINNCNDLCNSLRRAQRVFFSMLF